MYHLSTNPNLPSTLIPAQPLTAGERERNLPPRVCFAPTVEQCVYALWDTPWFIKRWLQMRRNQNNTIRLYLYQGVPDEDTKYLAKKEVLKHVYDAQYTEEIDVITPIVINAIGLVEIRFNLEERVWVDINHPVTGERYMHHIGYKVIEWLPVR